ncbi:hypothetical protein PIB30_074416 [Stylosanthes scabra]|uniref:Uncharacterized protein n=1 Tax=Stylosanthes scabra TaxID=79078 RepID=A0ABU6UP25_9FABA|nr:hypothetical protein [Stylosanthes scabra]
MLPAESGKTIMPRVESQFSPSLQGNHYHVLTRHINKSVICGSTQTYSNTPISRAIAQNSPQTVILMPTIPQIKETNRQHEENIPYSSAHSEEVQ